MITSAIFNVSLLSTPSCESCSHRRYTKSMNKPRRRQSKNPKNPKKRRDFFSFFLYLNEEVWENKTYDALSRPTQKKLLVINLLILRFSHFMNSMSEKKSKRLTVCDGRWRVCIIFVNASATCKLLGKGRRRSPSSAQFCGSSLNVRFAESTRCLRVESSPLAWAHPSVKCDDIMSTRKSARC